MAGSLIPMPANGDTSWTNFVTKMTKIERFWNGVSLTNTTSTGIPAIEAGSYTCINGAFYNLTPSTGGNETITGATGIAAGKEAYIKAVAGGTSVTCAWTTVPPTWSQAKGGYYNGDDKYIGGAYKSTGPWQTKFVYDGKLPHGLVRPELESELNLGAWNMDANSAITIKSKLYDFRRIKHITAIISNNAGSMKYNLIFGNWVTGKMSGGSIIQLLSTSLSMNRIESTSGGNFDSTSYNSTSINRGILSFLIKA